jgi:hypothetical protein
LLLLDLHAQLVVALRGKLARAVVPIDAVAFAREPQLLTLGLLSLLRDLAAAGVLGRL